MSSEKGYVLGIDESGTGAWAGPFVVAGVLLHRGQQIPGIKDSKKISDKKRRRLMSSIAANAIRAHHVRVEVSRINRSFNGAWVWGVKRILEEFADWGPSIIIDGKPVKEIAKIGSSIRFMVRADKEVPAVIAASIYAKTVRNDMLIELSERFPEFGFERNFGYGTSEHREALHLWGKTIQHRDYKPLQIFGPYKGFGKENSNGKEDDNQEEEHHNQEEGCQQGGSQDERQLQEGSHKDQRQESEPHAGAGHSAHERSDRDRCEEGREVRREGQGSRRQTEPAKAQEDPQLPE